MSRKLKRSKSIQLLLGNSNRRFSGVTSTLLQVLPCQAALTDVAILGRHHIPPNFTTLNFAQFIRLCHSPLPDGRYRVFHARRNDEMIQALIAKKLFGAKLKIAFTSTAQREHSGFSRWLMQQMDAVISTCEAAARYLDHRPPDIIVPHGIDANRFEPAESRAEAWRKTGLPGEFGIGAFGRVRHSKGIDILVDAALPLLKQYAGATVVIIGECVARDLPFQRQLQERVNAAGLAGRFVFLGQQPFNELPGLFRAMTVVAALSREEGFGLTPLEAMASGTAVLCSQAGAWPEIIRNGVEGFSVTTDSVTAARDKLDALLANRDATAQMGHAGRKRVLADFTVQHEAQQLTHFLLSLADKPKQ